MKIRPSLALKMMSTYMERSVVQHALSAASDVTMWNRTTVHRPTRH